MDEDTQETKRIDLSGTDVPADTDTEDVSEYTEPEETAEYYNTEPEELEDILEYTDPFSDEPKIKHKKINFKQYFLEQAAETVKESWKKLAVSAAVLLAAVLYLCSSADPIASLYRRNFSENMTKLFPSFHREKSLIDYTFEEENAPPAVIPAENDDGILYNTEKRKKNVKSAVTIPFDSAANAKFCAGSSGLVCASPMHIYLIDKNGSVVLDEDTPIVDPLLSCSGSYTLLAHKDSNRLILYEDNEKKYDITVDENIKACSVSAKGDAVLVTDKQDYQGAISVYSNSGEQIFSWASGQNRITAAAISPSSRCIAATFMNADDIVYSSLRIFDINEGECCDRLEFADTLLFDVAWSGDIVTAFGDNSMVAATHSGTLISDGRFGDGELSHFSCGTDGSKALVLSLAASPVLQTYTKNCIKRSELLIDDGCDFVRVHGRRLLYNIGRDIILRRDNSDTVKVYSSAMDVLGLELLTTDTFAIIHSNSVEIIKL